MERDVYKKFEEESKKQFISNDQAKVDKVHAKGKMTAEERLDFLYDDKKYERISPWMKNSCTSFELYKRDLGNEGVVTAIGEVNERKVCSFSQDATVMGGAGGDAQGKKIEKMFDMAVKTGVPIVGLNDASGSRIQEGVAGLNALCRQFGMTTQASGWIPQISIILGNVAGGTAYATALTDFTIMANPIGKMFITGPNVIKSATGEDVTFDELGGCAVHGRKTGTAHFVAEGEEEAIKLAKRLLSFLPSNSREMPPVYECDDPIDRKTPEIKDIVPVNPNKGFEMRDIIRLIVDDGDFLEVQETFATSIIIGFARINGSSVGIVANQPRIMAGCLDINSAWKAARFVRTCDSFNIPLINLIDTPGYLPGVQQEHGGIIRNGAKLLFAYAEATVPKISVVVRKDYGGAYSAMCGKGMGADVVLSFPTGELAVMGADGAANLLFRKELKAAEDPDALRKEKAAEYAEEFLNPYRGAEFGIVDDIISPDVIREKLAFYLDALTYKDVWTPRKKHSNIPL